MASAPLAHTGRRRDRGDAREAAWSLSSRRPRAHGQPPSTPFGSVRTSAHLRADRFVASRGLRPQAARYTRLHSFSLHEALTVVYRVRVHQLLASSPSHPADDET